MQHPMARYLREVLGVTSVIVPNGMVVNESTKKSGHFNVAGDFNSPTAIVSFGAVAFSERELCQKMLMAVGAGPLLLIEFSSNQDVGAFEEFFKAYEGQNIWCFGLAGEEFLRATEGRRVLELPSLSELTDQTNPELLMQKKRDVWARLQEFQKTLQ